MADRLKGKVAIVTGAARGIGAAAAQVFAREGANVVLTDVLIDEGKQTAKGIGESALFIHHDVGDEDSWQQVSKEVESAFGGVDILVNNAAVFHMAPLCGTSTADYTSVVKVNQFGVYFGIRAVAPSMMRRGGGSIVNVSSVDGLEAVPMSGAYVASKFAVTGMTKVAAMELAMSGIRVNSVHPGGVRTPIIEEVDVSDMLPTIPLARLAEPIEVANVLLFLASDEASYCTGGAYLVDGGFTAGHGMELINRMRP